MKVVFASGYCPEGTGIARYQRELIDAYGNELPNLSESLCLTFFTPFNRSRRPATLPNAYSFSRSRLYGKLQQLLNLQVGLPIELIIPELSGADLIHSLDPQYVQTRKPWVVTVHDVAWRKLGPDYANVFSRSMQRSAERCISSADHIIAVSNFTADQLMIGGVSSSRISVIYQGVHALRAAEGNLIESEELLSGTAASLQFDLPERYFLYVGTFHPRKNLSLIARAYRLPSTISLPPCLFVGPKPDLPLENYGIDGVSLRYLGYLSDSDLLRLLRGARALIFPSIYEGFGRPLVEAMAMGIPVIASRIPAFVEVADHAALFFDVHENAAAQLRDQLTLIECDDNLVAELRDLGRQRAIRFSWQESCRQLHDLHLRVIANSA